MKKIIISFLLITSLISGCSYHQNADNSAKLNNKSSKSKFLPKEARTLLNEGIQKLKNGNVNGAILDFQDLTKLYPDITIAHYNLGLAYAKNNQIPDAIKSWEQTISLDSGFADVYYNLAQAYKMTGNNKKTSENLIKYLDMRPNDPQAANIRKEISKLKEPVVGNGIIGRISITDEVDFDKNIALNSKNLLDYKTPVIYTCIELVNVPKNTSITANWFYRAVDNQKIPVNSLKFSDEGSKNILLSLKKPNTDWPIGKYELELLVNNKKNSVISFNIQKQEIK